MKDILIYIFAILLGLLIIMTASVLFGSEEAIITTIGFILGKLLLNDIKKGRI
jgi:hypothetical protein